MFQFTLQTIAPQHRARRAHLAVRSGSLLQTPMFMPVATLGAIKSLTSQDIDTLQAGMLLANAYHLMLRPGAERVAELGGLHKMMGHRGAILTDSGGFQVFSLQGLRKVRDEGVIFRSHLDGQVIELSPERLVQVQECLGSDIGMVLDECPPANSPVHLLEQAVDRTTLWADRCLAAKQRRDMAWFGICQGGLSLPLRERHAACMAQRPFEGFAVGGVSVGESPEDIDRLVAFTAPLLPENKPRYLMGVGTPRDLILGVAAGIDMFDCVMPARNARNGQLFTWSGRCNIKNSRYAADQAPIDERCACPTCARYSRAYLRHLFVAKELSYFPLATMHNLWFYLDLMATIRRQLDAGVFEPQPLIAQVTGQHQASPIVTWSIPSAPCSAPPTG